MHTAKTDFMAQAMAQLAESNSQVASVLNTLAWGIGDYAEKGMKRLKMQQLALWHLKRDFKRYAKRRSQRQARRITRKVKKLK